MISVSGTLVPTMAHRRRSVPLRDYLGDFAPEDLAAEYDPWRTAEPGVDYATRFAQLSERTRAKLPSSLGIPFGPTRAETLDIFPAAPSGAPVAVFLHGGYWRANTSREFSFVAEGLVATGMTTVVVNYALCPTVSLSEIVRQARAAVVWIHDHIGEFGGDPGRVNLIGHSAGAHLCAMALATRWTEDYRVPPDSLTGACLISGLYDLVPIRYTPVQANLQISWQEVLELSPLWNLPEVGVPIVVSCGGRESGEFRRQSWDLLNVLREAGHSVEWLEQPDSDHFAAIEGFLDPASPLCRGIARLAGVAVSQGRDLSGTRARPPRKQPRPR